MVKAEHLDPIPPAKFCARAAAGKIFWHHAGAMDESAGVLRAASCSRQGLAEDSGAGASGGV